MLDMSATRHIERLPSTYSVCTDHCMVSDVLVKRSISLWRRLMNRRGLESIVADYLLGYKKEVRNVIRRRVVLQDSGTVDQVRRDHQVGRLRMRL